MQVQVERKGAHEFEVVVRVPYEEYAREVEAALRRLQKRVQLPGFRRGRAPVALLRKQFAHEAHEDAVDALVQRYAEKALAQSKLAPVVRPLVTAAEAPAPNEDFVFRMQVAEWPRVELKPLSEITIAPVRVEVRKEDVEEAIARIRRARPIFAPQPDRAAERGDRVKLDLEVETEDGMPVKEASGEGLELVLNEELPAEIVEGLVGAKAGDTRRFTMQAPQDHPRPELRGKTLIFHAKVHEVAVPREAKDEEKLAKALGMEDASALRERVREDLEKEVEHINREEEMAAFWRALTKAHDVQLPEMLVQEEARALWRDLVRRLESQGISRDDPRLRDPALLMDLRRRAETDLVRTVLMQEIVKAGEITVDDEEVEQEIEAMAARFPENQREEAKRALGQGEQRERIRAEIEVQKAIKWALSQVRREEGRTLSLAEWEAERKASEGKEEP